MKAATQACYWLAAGVLALGLNGYYQDGGLQGLHRLANCAETRVAGTRAQFSQMASAVEVAMATPADPRCERSAATAVVAVRAGIPPQAQARLAHLQERLGEMQAARIQARMARLQQVMAQRELRRVQVEWQDTRISVGSDEGKIDAPFPPLPRVEISVPPSAAIEVTPN